MNTVALRYPDGPEQSVLCAIAFQAVEVARKKGRFSGGCHGFDVESASCRVRHHGRKAVRTWVGIRFGDVLLDQQVLLEWL